MLLVEEQDVGVVVVVFSALDVYVFDVAVVLSSTLVSLFLSSLSLLTRMFLSF